MLNKTRFVLSAVMLSVAGAALADATETLPDVSKFKKDSDGSYRLTIDQLPAEVRSSFEKQANGNPIRGISLEIQDGKAVYDCDVFNNGKKFEMIADSKGTLLNKPGNIPAAVPVSAPAAGAAASKPADGAKEIAFDKVPDPVSKTFKANFPKAKIEKLEVENEGGVDVYDFEFANGDAEQECDIAADGTLLEVTLVIHQKDLPDAAMKAIAIATEGGKILRLEKIDITHETKDGKVVKLEKPVTHYSAEFDKGDKEEHEFTCTPDGKEYKE